MVADGECFVHTEVSVAAGHNGGSVANVREGAHAEKERVYVCVCVCVSAPMRQLKPLALFRLPLLWRSYRNVSAGEMPSRVDASSFCCVCIDPVVSKNCMQKMQISSRLYSCDGGGM